MDKKPSNHASLKKSELKFSTMNESLQKKLKTETLPENYSATLAEPLSSAPLMTTVAMPSLSSIQKSLQKISATAILPKNYSATLAEPLSSALLMTTVAMPSLSSIQKSLQKISTAAFFSKNYCTTISETLNAYSLMKNQINTLKVQIDSSPCSNPAWKESAESILNKLETLPVESIDESPLVVENITASISKYSLKTGTPPTIQEHGPIKKEEEIPFLEWFKNTKIYKYLSFGFTIIGALSSCAGIASYVSSSQDTAREIQFMTTICRNLEDIKKNDESYQQQSLEYQKESIELDKQILEELRKQNSSL